MKHANIWFDRFPWILRTNFSLHDYLLNHLYQYYWLWLKILSSLVTREYSQDHHEAMIGEHHHVVSWVGSFQPFDFNGIVLWMRKHAYFFTFFLIKSKGFNVKHRLEKGYNKFFYCEFQLFGRWENFSRESLGCYPLQQAIELGMRKPFPLSLSIPQGICLPYIVFERQLSITSRSPTNLLCQPT